MHPWRSDRSRDEAGQAVDHRRGGTEVAAEAPAVGDVAEAAQVVAQRAGGVVVAEEAGQHHDGVAVARRQPPQDPFGRREQCALRQRPGTRG